LLPDGSAGTLPRYSQAGPVHALMLWSVAEIYRRAAALTGTDLEGLLQAHGCERGGAEAAAQVGRIS